MKNLTLSSAVIAAVIALAFFSVGSTVAKAQASPTLPIADVHVHYSHDSVEWTPPERVIEIMREANLKFALVSSAGDEGTRLLVELAPDLIVPELRPYSRNGQTVSWFTNEDNLAYVEKLIEQNRYAAIGEFHLFGDNADLPIPRRIVQLADEHNLILHAHSDIAAVERLLAQSATVKVIWAHAGFDDPAKISAMLDKHDRLWADLAFRSEIGARGTLNESWIDLFKRHPSRMMLGTDTFTPERMHLIPSHAEHARIWLDLLPEDIAQGLAWKNAYDLIMPVWNSNREKPRGVDCDTSDAEIVLTEDGLSVSIHPLGDITVSEPFPVEITVCGDAASDAIVTLDASMPAHGHGMNYAPSHEVIAQGAKGQVINVEGVVLHMPGEWQWSVNVQTTHLRKTLTYEFNVQ